MEPVEQDSNSFRRHRVRWALVVAAIALVSLGGIVYASIPGPDAVIHGCYNTQNGQLRVLDSSTASCGKNETAIQWNQTGPQGAAGLPGPIGPTGQTGATGQQGPAGTPGVAKGYALINPVATNGNFPLVANKSASVIGVVHTSTGVYCFDLDFLSGNAVATLAPGYTDIITALSSESGPGSPNLLISSVCPAPYLDAVVVIYEANPAAGYPRQDASFNILFN
jgi:hypothetical protein